jgi:hypothetical protein
MRRATIVALWLAAGCHDSVVPLGDAPAASPDGASDGAPDGGTPAYIAYEKFNTMPTGEPPTSPWTSESGDSGSIRVREVPFAFDKSVEISKPTGEGTAGLSTTIPSLGGRIVFEAKVKARETAGFKAIPYVYDANGNAIASVSFQDGAIRTHIGSTTSVVQPFVANVWYLVRLLVDTDQGTFDLYVDGVRKQRAALLRTPGSVAKLRYYLDGAGAGTLLVDNIRIYAEASYIGSAPSPVFDVRDFGAVGNGSANDQQAIQAAIEMAAGTGGSVLLTKGTYRTGTLTLRSHMTFFIDPSAVLLGSTSAADYPAQTPGTGNTQLSNCKARAVVCTQRNRGDDRWRRDDRWSGRFVLRRRGLAADVDLGRAVGSRERAQPVSEEGRDVESREHGVRPRADLQHQPPERQHHPRRYRCGRWHRYRRRERRRTEW